MMKFSQNLTCKFQYFSDRFVYELAKGSEVYEPGSAEKEKTLADTLREAEEALKNADLKLKKIETYYEFSRPSEDALKKSKDKPMKLSTKREIDPVVEEAYLNFLQKWFELKRFLSEAKKWAGKSGEKVKTDQDVVDKTIAELEEMLSGFREKQQKHYDEVEKKHVGDPMYSGLDKLVLDEAPLYTPTDKKKKPAAAGMVGKVPEAKPKDKPQEKEPAKNTQEYWLFQISRVVQKLQAGGMAELAPDEKKAIMFFCNPGKSRDYVYNDNGVNKHVILQRDTSGKFLRILDPSGQAVDSSYVAFSGTTDAKPTWPGSRFDSKEGGASAPAEKFANTFARDLAWLKSSKAKVGARVSVNINLVHQKKDDTENWNKLWLEVIKGVDGNYRVTTKTQRISRNGKMIIGEKPEKETSHDFSSLADAEKFAKEHFTNETIFTRIDGTEKDAEAEQKYAEEKRNKQLERFSGLVVRSLVPIFIKDQMDKNMEGLSQVLTQYKMNNWESKVAFIGRFTVRVKDGIIQVVDLQPGGIGTPKGKQNEAIAYQRSMNTLSDSDSAVA
ncbi:hypothetical protein IT413_00945 [Candidatus Peregrinibacteria bacterium]|nr:hypothetical protein [Candidatus Peregrinibacteria bacterium]